MKRKTKNIKIKSEINKLRFVLTIYMLTIYFAILNLMFFPNDRSFYIFIFVILFNAIYIILLIVQALELNE